MSTKKRLIDANALISEYAPFLEKAMFEGDALQYTHFKTMVFILQNAPTVDAVEVVHGRWEPHPHAYGFERCSVCHDFCIWGEWADGKKWNYCPNCGAKMDLEE